jgi:hypothetical protein
MPSSVSYLPELNAVLIVYDGVISPDMLLEAAQSALALSREHGSRRFLADCSALAGGHSVIDLYGLAKMLEAAGFGRDSREAIVLPQLAAAAADVRFWETTCRNRGFDVCVFETAAPARRWLARDEPRGGA